MSDIMPVRLFKKSEASYIALHAATDCLNHKAYMIRQRQLGVDDLFHAILREFLLNALEIGVDGLF